MSIKENVPEQNWETDLTTGTLDTSEYDTMRIMYPLQMEFQPKEDITAYELAKCLKHLWYPTYQHELDEDNVENTYLRHFNITDPNKRN